MSTLIHYEGGKRVRHTLSLATLYGGPELLDMEGRIMSEVEKLARLVRYMLYGAAIMQALRLLAIYLY